MTDSNSKIKSGGATKGCIEVNAYASTHCRNVAEKASERCAYHNWRRSQGVKAVVKNKEYREIFSCPLQIREWLKREPKACGLTKSDYICLMLEREMKREKRSAR